MAMETAMVVILDHHNPHDFAGDGGFSAFFDQEEEQQLLLEALDAELAQELQFHEALRASLMISSPESSPASDETQTAPSSPTPPATEAQIPSGPDPDSQAEVKWEAGESSQSFCEICRERKEDHQVVRNVYEDDNGGYSCVCFDCINVNAGGKRVNDGCYDKKGKSKTKKLHKKKIVAAPTYKDHHFDASSNRRHFPTNRSPPRPPRVDSRSVGDVEERLKIAKEEIRLLTDRIQLQHQESMEAMDFQEQFFKDQIKSIMEGRGDDGKEEKEEIAADCHSGSSSEPEPVNRPTKHLNRGMQRIMGEIEKMRRNKCGSSSSSSASYYQ